jgi:hypothetical protein
MQLCNRKKIISELVILQHISNISIGCNTVPIILAADNILRQYFWRYIASSTRPIYPEIAYIWAVLTENGNKV